MHGDGGQPLAEGHLSDSGDLNIALLIYFAELVEPLDESIGQVPLTLEYFV